LPKLNVETSYSKNWTESPDVCIIGTGAAGCVLAYELSEKGKTVVMLERGNHYTVDDIRKIVREEDLSKFWKNRAVFLSRNYSVNIAQGECVGGSTIINYGICFEIPQAVLSYWNVAFGLDIASRDLQDAYNQVREKIGISTLKEEDAGESHKKLQDGCKKLGYSSGWMDKAYDSAKKEKHNAMTAYLEKANPERVKVFANCTADKVVVKNNKVQTIKGFTYNEQTKQSYTVTVNPKIAIISAGPIASSEILLRNKLANSNDQVGKHLSLHPSTSVIAMFDDKINGDEGMAMAYYCDEFSVRKTNKPGFMIESVFVPPSQFSIAIPSFGEKNYEYMKKYNHCAMAGILVHDEPSGTISLNWGDRAVVDYNLSTMDQYKMLDGLKETARIFFRAGARNVITGHIKETVLWNETELRLIEMRGAGMGSLQIQSVHPQGGNRMGNDPSNSVVNPNCRTHEIENLYVCDASVFPTSIGVNPQFTIMAIATIVSKHINEKYF